MPHLPPPPFYSPSFPPPPLPQVSAQMILDTKDNSNSLATSTANNSTLVRLHPSLSVPNIRVEIQQSTNILPTSTLYQVPLQHQILQSHPAKSALLHQMDNVHLMIKQPQQVFVPTGVNLQLPPPPLFQHGTHHQFASSAGVMIQPHQQQFVPIQNIYHQPPQNRNSQQVYLFYSLF